MSSAVAELGYESIKLEQKAALLAFKFTGKRHVCVIACAVFRLET